VPWHGLNCTYTAHAKHEVRQALFLPFDLEALEFFRDAPHSSRSRIQQRDACQAQHRMVHDLSRLSQSADARQLVDGWYDGDLVAGTLHGSFVPPAWSGTGQSYPLASPHMQLSRTVSAHACRTGHISSATRTTRASEGCTITSLTEVLSGQEGYWQPQRQKRRGRWWWSHAAYRDGVPLCVRRVTPV
jgi:hypothetical protein